MRVVLTIFAREKAADGVVLQGERAMMNLIVAISVKLNYDMI